MLKVVKMKVKFIRSRYVPLAIWTGCQVLTAKSGTWTPDPLKFCDGRSPRQLRNQLWQSKNTDLSEHKRMRYTTEHDINAAHIVP